MKAGIIIILTLLLIFIIPAENSSSPFRKVELQTISAEQESQILQSFYNDQISHIDSFLQRSNKNYRFHGNVLIAHDGEIILNNSYGYKDFPSKNLHEANSVFQLASVSM